MSRILNSTLASSVLNDKEASQSLDSTTQNLLRASAEGRINAAYIDNFKADDLINAFIPIFNKFGRQVVFDLLGGWNDPLTEVFLRDSNTFGLYTGLLSVNADPDKDKFEYQIDDGEGNDQFAVIQPDVNEAVITLTDKPQYPVSVTYVRLREAFINSYGFEGVTAEIIDSVRKKALLDQWKLTRKALFNVESKNILPYYVSKSTLEDSDSAKKLYAEITDVVDHLAEPSAKYNTLGYYSNLTKGRGVFIFNNKQNIYVNFNVLASLFNSDKVNNAPYFKKILSVVTDDYPDFIGAILDPDIYRVELTHNSLEAAYNKKNKVYTFWQTTLRKRGFNPALDGVILTNKVVDPWVEKYITKDPKGKKHTFFKINGLINAQTYYTTDGTDPSTDGTRVLYDGYSKIEVTSTKTVKVISILDPSTKSQVVTEEITVE